MTMISKGLFDLMRGYGALLPARLLSFPSCTSWKDIHNFLLEGILLNPHYVSYPPSREYQRFFWKFAIDCLDNVTENREEDDEIDVRIYDHYMSLLPQSTSLNTGIPTPSYSTQFWSTDSSYLDENIVDLALFRKSTLWESRTFIEKGTTGFRTWPASLALAEYIVKHTDIIANKHVLELGSGAGFLGIISGSVQVLFGGKGSTLHLTDVNEEVLERCQNNINLPCNISSHHHNVQYHVLDWSNISQSSITNLLGGINAEVILGADLVFDPDLIPALVETIFVALQESRNNSMPTKTAILALTVRNKETFNAFEQLAKQTFNVHELETPKSSMFLGLPEGKQPLNEVTRNVKMIQLSQKTESL